MNKIDINNIPLDDKKTYDLLSSGKTNGIFQLESSGMKGLCKRLKPSEFKHIDAIVALFRPGALQFIEEYIENKNNSSKIKYIDDRIKPILEKTYGQIIYQEQVMSVAQVLAGYTLGEADSLRRAIGKKNIDEMKQNKDKFISGCINNGLNKNVAENLYNQIEVFANYSFNQSHSAAYGMIAYQTAYLKANYFTDYMCSLLDGVADNDDKKEKYISECFEFGVNVLSPKINASTLRFEKTKDNNIVFPLNAIKGLGIKACEKITKERCKNGDYKSFLDFCIRTMPDKKTIESLLYSNCFSELESYPRKWINIIEYLCSAISDYKKDKTMPLMDLVRKYIHKDLIKQDNIINKLIQDKRNIVGHSKASEATRKSISERIEQRELELCPMVETKLLEDCSGFSKAEIRDNELKYLSYQITTNSDNIFSKYKDKFNYCSIENLAEKPLNSEIVLVGKLKDTKAITTKGGKKMAFSTLCSEGNSVGLTIFPTQWESMHNIKDGDYVKIVGKIQENANKEFGDLNIIVNKLSILDCLATEEIYVQDIDNFSEEDMETYKKGLTILSEMSYNKNRNIERILVFRKNDKLITSNSKFWISDLDEYRGFLSRYKLNK